MVTEIEQRILALLRSDPDPMVPLTRLHAALVAELGPRGGTYAQLHQRIRRRPDLFLLLEPLSVPWSDDGWGIDLQREYERALRDAGLDTGPRVALATPDSEPPAASGADPAAPVLRMLQESLVHLWASAADDPQLQAELVEALGQAEELRRVLQALPPDDPAPPARAGARPGELPRPGPLPT